MSILTLEVKDSEKSKFIDLISSLKYINIIDDEQEDQETLKLIERAVQESLDIESGKSDKYSLQDLYSELKK